jgi:hypothetical protein
MRLRTPATRRIADLLSVSVESTDKMPVSLAQAMRYARVDDEGEDIIVDVLIQASREDFEDWTGKLLYKRDVTAKFSVKGYSFIYVPWLPIVEVISVKDDDDNDIDYTVEGDSILVNTTGNVTVVYTAGLTDENVDKDIQVGCLKWIVSNYEDRQNIAAMGVHNLPNDTKSHWIKYKNAYI